jgi:hypothetical protein
LENIRLKRRINELEDALSPKPLFAEPLAIISPRSNATKYTQDIYKGEKSHQIAEWS